MQGTALFPLSHISCTIIKSSRLHSSSQSFRANCHILVRGSFRSTRRPFHPLFFQSSLSSVSGCLRPRPMSPIWEDSRPRCQHNRGAHSHRTARRDVQFRPTMAGRSSCVLPSRESLETVDNSSDCSIIISVSLGAFWGPASCREDKSHKS